MVRGRVGNLPEDGKPPGVRNRPRGIGGAGARRHGRIRTRAHSIGTVMRRWQHTSPSDAHALGLVFRARPHQQSPSRRFGLAGTVPNAFKEGRSVRELGQGNAVPQARIEALLKACARLIAQPRSCAFH